jgi:hypothetical protein
VKDIIKQIASHKTKRNKMARPVIGVAKFGFVQKKFEKVGDGESVWGILPPIGQENADAGRWSFYYSVQYGYKNPAGKARPFLSCEVKSRKPPYMIEVADAATERLKMLDGQYQKAKAEGNEAAKTAILKLAGGQKSLYNTDNNHYVNAIDLQGNIVVLKMRHKAKLALDEEIKKLRTKGIEPLGIENRRFFVFTRTGTKNETAYKVSVYKEKLHVEGIGEVEKDFVYSLTDEILDRLGDEAGKLESLFKAPTPEQVARIVKESVLVTGVSPNIDEILGMSASANASDSPAENQAEDSKFEEQPAATSSVGAPLGEPLVAATTTPAPALTAPVPNTTTTQVSPIQSTPVFAPPLKSAPAPLTTTAEQLSAMSDKEFLASLGVPQ